MWTHNPIKYYVWEKDYIWNSNTCGCEINNSLKSIIGDSLVTCGEIIKVVAKSYNDTTKNTPTNFNEKRKPVRWKVSIFYLPFY